MFLKERNKAFAFTAATLVMTDYSTREKMLTQQEEIYDFINSLRYIKVDIQSGTDYDLVETNATKEILHEVSIKISNNEELGEEDFIREINERGFHCRGVVCFEDMELYKV